MACLLRWVEGGGTGGGKKPYGQYALSRGPIFQQGETNQQQALVVCLGVNILILEQKIPNLENILNGTKQNVPMFYRHVSC